MYIVYELCTTIYRMCIDYICNFGTFRQKMIFIKCRREPNFTKNLHPNILVLYVCSVDNLLTNHSKKDNKVSFRIQPALYYISSFFTFDFLLFANHKKTRLKYLNFSRKRCKYISKYFNLHVENV